MSGQAPTAAELEVQRLRAALAVAEAKASAVCEARVVPTASAAPVSHADTTQVLTAVAQARPRRVGSPSNAVAGRYLRDLQTFGLPVLYIEVTDLAC